MASIIDFTDVTFSNEEVRALNELMFLDYVEAGEFAQFHDVHTDIVSGKEIAWIGEMADIGRASRGCNPVDDTAGIDTVKKLWDPKEFDARLKECYTDIAATMAVYARNTGTDVADLTETDYFNVIGERFGRAINRMVWRTWIMDTTHTLVGAGTGTEEITAGQDITLVNIVDGYWKQIADIVAAAPDQQTVVAANAEATKALQLSALTPTLALGYLMDATYNMPVELVQRTDKVGMITRYFANQAKRAFQATNTHPDAYMAVRDGVELLIVNGVEFAIIDEWTKQIETYHNLGDTFLKPHRAVITTRDNLAYGITSANTFGVFNTWYEKKDRASYIELIDQIDVKVMQDKLIQVVY